MTEHPPTNCTTTINLYETVYGAVVLKFKESNFTVVRQFVSAACECVFLSHSHDSHSTITDYAFLLSELCDITLLF